MRDNLSNFTTDTLNEIHPNNGVSCSAYTFVQGGNSVLRINICAEKSAQRKSARRYTQANKDLANKPSFF